MIRTNAKMPIIPNRRGKSFFVSGTPIYKKRPSNDGVKIWIDEWKDIENNLIPDEKRKLILGEFK